MGSTRRTASSAARTSASRARPRRASRAAERSTRARSAPVSSASVAERPRASSCAGSAATATRAGTPAASAEETARSDVASSPPGRAVHTAASARDSGRPDSRAPAISSSTTEGSTAERCGGSALRSRRRIHHQPSAVRASPVTPRSLPEAVATSRRSGSPPSSIPSPSPASGSTSRMRAVERGPAKALRRAWAASCRSRSASARCWSITAAGAPVRSHTDSAAPSEAAVGVPRRRPPAARDGSAPAAEARARSRRSPSGSVRASAAQPCRMLAPEAITLESCSTRRARSSGAAGTRRVRAGRGLCAMWSRGGASTQASRSPRAIAAGIMPPSAREPGARPRRARCAAVPRARPRRAPPAASARGSAARSRR